MNITKPYRIELAKTLTGHWYAVWEGEEFLGYFPSSTTILNAYPQSAHLTQWIAEKGWNESQRIKSEAGERGTAVHTAIESLINGVVLENYGYGIGMNRPYSLEEWLKISTFVSWWQQCKPEIIATEMAVFSKTCKFAGRVDFIAKIAGEFYVVDWKTSGSVHNHFPLQFASYAQAIEEMTDIEINRTACLQLGAKNKDGFRFVTYPDWKSKHLPVFLNVRATWEYEYGKAATEPPVLILPAKLNLYEPSQEKAEGEPQGSEKRPRSRKSSKAKS